MAERSKEQVRSFADKVADSRGWIVNPDAGFRETVIDGLRQNVNRYGYFLCPCRDTNGDRASDRDVICPCVYAKQDVNEFGHCYCALFVSADLIESGGEIAPIPERRPAERI